MKKLLVLLTITLVFLTGTNVRGSHIRAGEITAERISAGSFTYEITLVLYVKTSSGIFEDSVELSTSDGWQGFFPLIENVSVGTDVTRLKYRKTRTFNNGIIRIRYRDQNRVDFVQNMDNSGLTAFYIETMMVLDPLMALNDTPELLVPPIDDGAVGQVYNYNPGAFDINGDSLSYEMDIPHSAEGVHVIGYEDPGQFYSGGAEELTLDSVFGNMIWDFPDVPGIYNVAYRIYEWRNGIIIGYIHRDMQITIVNSDNEKPIQDVPPDTCVQANLLLTDTIYAIDPDLDFIELDVFSGIIPPATYDEFDPFQVSFGIFNWTPTCNDIRENPYQVIFKASDSPSKNPSLVDITTWNIKVLGPKVDSLKLQEISSPGEGVQLIWDLYNCQNAENINIYRRGCDANYSYDPCLENSPAYNGYELIGSVPPSANNYFDLTVTNAQEYCYLVQAEFAAPEGGHGYPSDEQCIITGAGDPYITRVSVTQTGTTDGQIEVLWREPLDTSVTFDNADVELWRSDDGGNTYNSIGGAPFGGFIDAGLNTREIQYFYKITTDSLESNAASSVFLNLTSGGAEITLEWNDSVPWNNYNHNHHIYSMNVTNGETGFTLIDSVFVMFEKDQNYIHTGLRNGDSICYYVTTNGSYCNDSITNVLANNSQISCTVPKDETPPCPPNIRIQTDCEADSNYQTKISFTPIVEPPLCIDDVSKYDIWFAEHEGDVLQLLDTVAGDTLFRHNRINSIAGCYYVTASDKSGNISESSDTVCADNCPRFVLPNVFTPNNDEHNSLFTPIPPTRFVKSLDIVFYNRWGRKVFSTTDPDINWDGTNNQGSLVTDGMYYYKANVNFHRLNVADEPEEFKGWVRIFR